jgi:hypothetical protein
METCPMKTFGPRGVGNTKTLLDHKPIRGVQGIEKKREQVAVRARQQHTQKDDYKQLRWGTAPRLFTARYGEWKRNMTDMHDQKCTCTTGRDKSDRHTASRP